MKGVIFIFDGIRGLLIQIIQSFAGMISYIFAMIFPGGMDILEQTSFNIYLFSDTGWFTQPIPLIFLFQFVVIGLLLIFLLRLLWKGTKKFINLVFGVFKL